MQNSFFPEVKKNFGFGCMRLPMNGGTVDLEQFKKMTDAFIANGFNYFDTAHVYIGGQSETAIREAVSKRYPREQFILTDKLTNSCFHSQADIRPFFEMQLEACGVDYFDFYLMHAQDSSNYPKYRECRAYETAFELKAEGKIRHVGISFHDKAAVLERILTDYPQIEVVQIQFNYVDYEDGSVESRKVYEVCEKYNKPVIVMEPVKGGSLVNLPADAQKVFDALDAGMSNASYALRFAASFPQMFMTLSGMSNLEQMRDMFRDIRLLVENTGTVSEGTVLLDQAEFTALCRDRDLDVMIDVGHANANGWDLADLIGGLRNQIRGFHFHNNDGCHDLHDRIGEGSLDFDRLMPLIRQCVPEALWVIEYIRPSCHGKPLLEDIARMRIYAEEAEKCQM